jgi:SOS-response transcriptional repressor LexA
MMERQWVTARQWQILDFIHEYWIENWTSPTVREIMEVAGLASSSTIAKHLENLVRMGMLERKRLSAGRVLYRLTDEALNRTARRGL